MQIVITFFVTTSMANLNRTTNFNLSNKYFAVICTNSQNSYRIWQIRNYLSNLSSCPNAWICFSVIHGHRLKVNDCKCINLLAHFDRQGNSISQEAKERYFKDEGSKLISISATQSSSNWKQKTSYGQQRHAALRCST